MTNLGEGSHWDILGSTPWPKHLLNYAASAPSWGTPLSPLLSPTGGGEDALMVALLLRVDTHVYSKRNNTGCGGVVATLFSPISGVSVALLFAYLAVRPTVRVATADGGRLVPDKPATSVKVESVRQGDLAA